MRFKKKILFVCYGGGHVNMVVPVIKRLMGDPSLEICVLGLTTAGVVLSKAGIPHIGFRDIVTDSDEAALEWGRRLGKGVSCDVVPAEETAAYLGLSYADLEARHGVDAAARIYGEKGRHAFLPVTALVRLLTRIQPDLVVATNAPRGERAAIVAAKELGIASLCLLDLYPPADDDWLNKDWYGTQICVLNESAKAALVARGRDPVQVVVTGNPAFDRHYTYQAPPRGNAAGKRTVVGFASNIIPGDTGDALQREVFDRLARVCARNNYQLALRQHPNEIPWLNHGDALDCMTIPLETYLSGLDVLVTFPSTVALEAQIHGVRVALLDFTPLSEACAYLFNGDFDSIRRVEEIDDFTVVPVSGASRQARPPTSAAANVCGVIKKILGE